jgi:hypothetical protein
MSVSIGFFLGVRPEPDSISPDVVAGLRTPSAATSLAVVETRGVLAETGPREVA